MVTDTNFFDIFVSLGHETSGKKHMAPLSLWEVQAIK